MTNLTGIRYIIKGRLNMMIRKFLTPFTFIRHMAISTRNATVSMYSCKISFITRMLCFKHRGLTQGMRPIAKGYIIVILFHFINTRSIFPRKDQIRNTFLSWNIFFKVIFCMALCAYQRSHFIMCSLRNIFTHSIKSLH